MADRWEAMETVTDFVFLVSKITAMVTGAIKLKDAAPWKKSYEQGKQHIKKVETLLCQRKSI